MAQYNGKWPYSLFCVLKPLITAIRAIGKCHFTGQPSRHQIQLPHANQSAQANEAVGLHSSSQSNQCQSAQVTQQNNVDISQQGELKQMSQSKRCIYWYCTSFYHDVDVVGQIVLWFEFFSIKLLFSKPAYLLFFLQVNSIFQALDTADHNGLFLSTVWKGAVPFFRCAERNWAWNSGGLQTMSKKHFVLRSLFPSPYPTPVKHLTTPTTPTINNTLPSDTLTTDRLLHTYHW